VTKNETVTAEETDCLHLQTLIINRQSAHSRPKLN